MLRRELADVHPGARIIDPWALGPVDVLPGAVTILVIPGSPRARPSVASVLARSGIRIDETVPLTDPAPGTGARDDEMSADDDTGAGVALVCRASPGLDAQELDRLNAAALGGPAAAARAADLRAELADLRTRMAAVEAVAALVEQRTAERDEAAAVAERAESERDRAVIRLDGVLRSPTYRMVRAAGRPLRAVRRAVSGR